MSKFNLIIGGVGGQGQIKLLQILAKAALFQKYDVKSSETHGLSQRSGSVEVHLRFGKNIHSPLVKQGDADLIIALEKQESLRLAYYSRKDKTIFLINDHLIPIINKTPLKNDFIKENLKKISKDIIFIPATKICKEKLNNELVTGVFLASFASYKNLIPINIKNIEKAIKNVIAKEMIDINIKALRLPKFII